MRTKIKNMKKAIFNISIGGVIGVLLMVGVLLYFTPEKETIGINLEPAPTQQAVELLSQHFDSTGLSANFPYSKFASELSFPHPNEILQLLDTLHSRKPNDTLNNITLLHSLMADSSFSLDTARWSNYNADATWEAIHWVDILKATEKSPDLNSNTQLLFQALQMSWMDFIARHLTENQKKDWRLKHQATFVMLNLECQKRNYNLAFGYSNLEKGIIRLSNNEFAYILKRIQGQLGILILFGFLVGLPLFVYGLYRILRHHWPEKKQSKKFIP